MAQNGGDLQLTDNERPGTKTNDNPLLYPAHPQYITLDGILDFLFNECASESRANARSVVSLRVCKYMARNKWQGRLIERQPTTRYEHQ